MEPAASLERLPDEVLLDIIIAQTDPAPLACASRRFSTLVAAAAPAWFLAHAASAAPRTHPAYRVITWHHLRGRPLAVLADCIATYAQPVLQQQDGGQQQQQQHATLCGNGSPQKSSGSKSSGSSNDVKPSNTISTAGDASCPSSADQQQHACTSNAPAAAAGAAAAGPQAPTPFDFEAAALDRLLTLCPMGPLLLLPYAVYGCQDNLVNALLPLLSPKITSLGSSEGKQISRQIVILWAAATALRRGRPAVAVERLVKHLAAGQRGKLLQLAVGFGAGALRVALQVLPEFHESK